MLAGKLKDFKELIFGSYVYDAAACAEFSGISIDSRTIMPGNIFVAIKGELNDGHEYLAKAKQSGATAFIVEKSNANKIPDDILACTIKVDDTKLALRQIGQWWKNKFDLITIALTGTNGKTTTKEMIADVLAQKYKVFRTPGNYNNLYGIPLSLCQLNDSYDIAVLELGMSYPGEIETLTKLVNPDLALITNIGPAHLETMGTIENIASAKFELLDNLSGGSTVILNLDDPILSARFSSEPHKKIGFAISHDADIRPVEVSANGFGRMKFDYENENIHLQIPGQHNLYNALAACAVAKYFDITSSQIKTALEKYVSTNARMQIIQSGTMTIIDDSYNANPTSMLYALQVLSQIETPGRKIALLGDMKELGQDEIELHQDVGRLFADLKLDLLVTCGKLGLQIATGANVAGFDSTRTHTFMQVQEAIEYLCGHLNDDDCLLVKASRAMQFDTVINALTQDSVEES